MSLKRHYSAAALLVLACAFEAGATGIDCKAAASAGERAICADDKLRRLDARLADAYAKALAESGTLGEGTRTALRRQQRTWLQQREPCGADAACLAAHYEQGIAALAMPDQADMAALEVLRQAVETARRSDPAQPVEKALEGLKIRSGLSVFDSEEDPHDPSGQRRLPQQPADVDHAEWRALVKSHIDNDGENGRASYMLLDLDGDGQRDLVIDSFTGGTGMVNSISVLRQVSGRFGVPGTGPGRAGEAPAEPPAGTYLYALSGRGGNQAAVWIRLGGRVYAAFREGHYGIDQVSLLRPWHAGGQVPRLTVRYRYRLSVPPVQTIGQRPAARLAPALQRALQQAVEQALVLAAKPAQAATPICPLPADAADDIRDASTGYGWSHYTIEPIADVPVQVGTQCHIGQLRSWYGGYDAKDGLAAELCMRKPEQQQPSEDDCYAVQGPRSVVGIEAGIGPN